jgi:transposase
MGEPSRVKTSPSAATGGPPADRRLVVETTAAVPHRCPWRDVPERFVPWNTIYKNFDRWAKAGVWAQALENVQSLVRAEGDLDWVASIDSTLVRVHPHGATLARDTGGNSELQQDRRRTT